MIIYADTALFTNTGRSFNMNRFNFFMPAHVYFGENCILENKDALRGFGEKALIVTGRHSAKKNGAQADITSALESLGKTWVLFDEVEENPSVETIVKAADFGKKEKADFVIGIGGGSPMDSAKAISCLLANPDKGSDVLFGKTAPHVPVIEIPTTAGTGSETTQFAIVTLHEKRTKSAISQKIFADASFLDAKYMATLSPEITNNTAVDALTHLIEAYMSKNANFFSDRLAEIGLDIFKECIPSLKSRTYSPEIREKLLLASTIAGMVIAQAGTSLPHAMGYFLTYEKGIPHGRSNGILVKAYLEQFPVQTKISTLLEHLDMSSLTELDELLKEVLHTTENFTETDIKYYSKEVSKNKMKLASYPYTITEEDLYHIYKKSLLS